jgi:hypothetical protein
MTHGECRNALLDLIAIATGDYVTNGEATDLAEWVRIVADATHVRACSCCGTVGEASQRCAVCPVRCADPHTPCAWRGTGRELVGDHCPACRGPVKHDSRGLPAKRCAHGSENPRDCAHCLAFPLAR